MSTFKNLEIPHKDLDVCLLLQNQKLWQFEAYFQLAIMAGLSLGPFRLCLTAPPAVPLTLPWTLEAASPGEGQERPGEPLSASQESYLAPRPAFGARAGSGRAVIPLTSSSPATHSEETLPTVRCWGVLAVMWEYSAICTVPSSCTDPWVLRRDLRGGCHCVHLTAEKMLTWE